MALIFAPRPSEENTVRTNHSGPAAALCALVLFLGLASGAQAASVLGYLNREAVKWQGTVIAVEPLAGFYKRQFGKGVWTTDKGLTRRGQELLQAFARAGEDGLEPADYLGSFPANPAALRGEDLAGAELYLSDAAARFARDLFGGRTTPSISEPDIVIPRKKLDLVALLGSFDKNGIEPVLARLRPKHPQYLALRKLLASNPEPKLSRKIVVNMERWRWLPRELGDPHVMVNAAAFSMVTIAGGKTIDRRRVIVGEEFHKTPMFSHAIETAEFNPTWTISRNIAGKEILPKLRRDPAYLEKKGYVIHTSWEADAPRMNPASVDWESVNAKDFPFRIVQPAGPDNVLGVVKFLFPNRFNVYLHDTSSRELFDQKDRALSHGCIRVEKPLEFADLLFGLDRSLKPDQIRSVVKSGKTTQARFKRPVPVHLAYFTLWFGDDGKMASYSDIYGRDTVVAKILFGGA
jgi:murein L,D-transpeptidase YcbB/YkuD